MGPKCVVVSGVVCAVCVGALLDLSHLWYLTPRLQTCRFPLFPSHIHNQLSALATLEKESIHEPATAVGYLLGKWSHL